MTEGVEGLGSHSSRFLSMVALSTLSLNANLLEDMARTLAATRERGGRVFFVGVGGGAANASHAVNDFRKIAEMDAYAPCDNVSEITARTNDDGWETSIAESLRVSRIGPNDVVFVFSVTGGGEDGQSPNIATAVRRAVEAGSTVMGVVGDRSSVTARSGQNVIVIDVADLEQRTPLTEAMQMIVSHLLVTHPLVAKHGCL